MFLSSFLTILGNFMMDFKMCTVHNLKNYSRKDSSYIKQGSMQVLHNHVRDSLTIMQTMFCSLWEGEYEGRRQNKYALILNAYHLTHHLRLTSQHLLGC